MLNGNAKSNDALEMQMGIKTYKFLMITLSIMMVGLLAVIIYSVTIIINGSWQPEYSYSLPLFIFVLILSTAGLILFSKIIIESAKSEKKYLN